MFEFTDSGAPRTKYTSFIRFPRQNRMTPVSDVMAKSANTRIEEISELVAFLCSENASFCVGSCVLADGGQGRT